MATALADCLGEVSRRVAVESAVPDQLIPDVGLRVPIVKLTLLCECHSQSFAERSEFATAGCCAKVRVCIKADVRSTRWVGEPLRPAEQMPESYQGEVDDADLNVAPVIPSQ